LDFFPILLLFIFTIFSLFVSSVFFFLLLLILIDLSPFSLEADPSPQPPHPKERAAPSRTIKKGTYNHTAATIPPTQKLKTKGFLLLEMTVHGFEDVAKWTDVGGLSHGIQSQNVGQIELRFVIFIISNA
jgi:hypothetical protein